MNKVKFTEFILSKRMMYVIIAMLMAVVFCSIYGIRILNPTYTDWLMKGGDPTQHYLGWRAYRISKWTFQICNTDYLSYPDEMSIIFTDSIPCCAILFKCISFILPQNFQYFGLWGLLCFILTGVLSAKIVSKFTDSRIIIILASLLLSFTPCMIWRIFKHTALGSQWILLLALEPLFAYKQYFKNKKVYIIWAIVGLCASSIHIYYILMCGIILCGYCIADIITFKRFKRSFMSLLIFLISSIIIVVIGGGFSAGVSPEAGGLGVFSTNLNALFNPQGWSCILPDLPIYREEQLMEGFAYLGAGNLLLLFISALLFIKYIITKQLSIEQWKEVIAVAIVFLTACILALSPTITLHDRCIYTFDFPESIIRYWSIFRATGRISWITIYVLIFFGCSMICKMRNKRWTAITLLVCIIIQVYDIHGVLRDKYSLYNQEQKYESLLKSESFWNYIGNDSNIRHIILTKREISKEEIYAFADFALNNRKTINQFYFARNMEDSIIDANIEDALEKPDESQLFIFFESNRDRCSQYDLNYYYVDGFIVGYKETLDIG